MLAKIGERFTPKIFIIILIKGRVMDKESVKMEDFIGEIEFAEYIKLIFESNPNPEREIRKSAKKNSGIFDGMTEYGGKNVQMRKK